MMQPFNGSSRLLRYTLASVLILGLTTACERGEKVEALLAQAKQYQEKGDNKAAIIQLKNVLQKQPDQAQARLMLGGIYLDTGEAAAAEKELRRALELQADRAKAQPQLVRALLLQAEFRKALDETKDITLVVQEATAEMFTLRGQAQLGLGDSDAAKQSFEQALAKQPDYPDALLGQARVAAGQKDLDGAVALVERVLSKAAPKHLDSLLMQADLQRLQGKTEAATASYQKVIEHYPDNIPARLSLAAIYIDANKFDEAKKYLEVVKKAAPGSPMGNYMQALLEFRGKNYPAARDAVLQVLKVAPQHLPSQLLAGTVQAALGANEQAETYLKAVLDKAPTNLYARRVLVGVLLKNRQPERALEALQPGLKQAPNDPGLLALAGEVYSQNKQFTRATEYFEKAAAIDPKSANTRTSLALSRLAAGETDRAMSDLESATELDADQYKADTLLIMTHISRGEFDQAAKALQGLQKKQPDNPLTYNMKAAILIGKKDLPGARAALEKALALQPGYFPAARNLASLDLKDNKPEAAKKRFQAILETDKTNLDAMLALAELAARANQGEEAVKWLEAAKKDHPNHPKPMLLLAQHYLRAEPKKALTLAQDAASANPDNMEVLDTLGQVQLAAGEKSAAVTTYTKLVAHEPKSPQALYRLASAQAAEGNQTAAAQSLKKALELKPDLLPAQAALAQLELRAGRPAEALKIAQQVQKQAPKAPAGWALEGDGQMAEKKYPEAAAAYEKALALGKINEIVVKLHAAYVRSGKPEQGEAKLQQWLKEFPNDAAVRLYVAETNLSAGKHKAAIEQYQWLQQKQPQNIMVLNNLAWAYQQVKDPRAVETAEQALKLEPGSAAVQDTLGWMLVEQGKTQRGLEWLQKAASAKPDVQEIRFHLAQAWLKAGDKAKAKAELEHIANSGIKFAQEAEAAKLLKELKN